VKSGKPVGLDLEEPKRLAETVATLDLKYAVITSVNRDDLPDGGASIFASCITQIRKKVPYCKVEVLTPDFEGSVKSLKTVISAKPDTFNHNIETVERIFPSVRAKGNYRLSLNVLKNAKEISADIITKSGIMVGLGETMPEIIQTLQDLRSVNCDLVTIGQYLKPTKKHAQTEKWYTPEEFKNMEEIGYNLGFKHVASGPLVRSSYHADQQHAAAQLIIN
jgi:lipoic acid synthetase